MPGTEREVERYGFTDSGQRDTESRHGDGNRTSRNYNRIQFDAVSEVKQEKSLTDRHEQLGGLGLYIRDLDSGDIDASRDAQAGQQGSGRGVKTHIDVSVEAKIDGGDGDVRDGKGADLEVSVTVRRGFSASTTVVVGMLMGPMPPLRVK